MKKNKLAGWIYHTRIISWLSRTYYSTLTLISPKLNTQARYRQAFGKRLNLTSPKTFNEKLLWLKLYRYNKDPLVAKCADKYAVREYIKDAGCEHILNELYAAYDSPKEVPWSTLPERFVLKWNFGAGMNVVCKNKNELDIKATTKKLKKWQKSKCWLWFSEIQYKYAPKS